MWLGGQPAIDQSRQELEQPVGDGARARLEQLVEAPPALLAERERLERFQPAGSGCGSVAPSDVHPLVLVEVQTGEGEAHRLGPHAGPDLGVADPGLLPELAADRVVGVLAPIDPTARDLPPLAPVPTAR